MIKIIRLLKYIYIVLIVSLVVTVAIIINKKSSNNTKNNEINEVDNNKPDYDNYDYFSDEYIYYKFGAENLTNAEKEKMLYYNENINEMLLEMMKKDGNWRCFPVIKDIKEQYDEKKGLLAEFDFDSVEYSNETLDILKEYGSTGRVSVVGTKNKQKKKVYMSIATNGGLENFSIDRVVNLTDENGNELDTRLRCTEENWQTILSNFVSQEIETQHTIAVTDSFIELYPDFRDVFLKKVPSQKDFTSVIYSIETQEKSDYSKLTATYRCFEIKDTKNMRLYKVHFILDDKQYIDDVEIEILE